YLHYSNAGLSEHNPGIELLNVGYSYRFYWAIDLKNHEVSKMIFNGCSLYSATAPQRKEHILRGLFKWHQRYLSPSK
ncbi:acyloxyacyl hydrolase, partial [Shewanella sp. C32]